MKEGKLTVKEKSRLEKPMVKSPARDVFRCHDGSVFTSLRELAEGFVAMSDETFAYHSNSERQDFSNWVKDVIGDELLANELSNADSRLQAAEYVVVRIALFKCSIDY